MLRWRIEGSYKGLLQCASGWRKEAEESGQFFLRINMLNQNSILLKL